MLSIATWIKIKMALTRKMGMKGKWNIQFGS